MSLIHFPPFRAPAASAWIPLVILCGCAGGPGKPMPGHQIPADMSFHRSLKIDEYLGSYPQEALPVPQGSEAVMQLIPFATSQPAGENRTLAMLEIRVRDSRPGDPQGGDSACIRDAMLTVKPAPGFSLLHLYGTGQPDTGAGTRLINLGDFRPGERMMLIAELGATQEAGKQRLLGATLRCTRVSDGIPFETLEGLSLEWQNNAPARMNTPAARNSLLLADAEALIEVGKLVEMGGTHDLETALSLVDLQLNSIELLMPLDSKVLKQERKFFVQVRKRLVESLKAKNGSGGASKRHEVAMADKPDRGIALASQAPKGPWTTVARLLVIPVKTAGAAEDDD
ncbi:MAG TPA: hypothetical protein VJ385_02225 [Fibrobacteria bacterium]|nr:hypothetical protein [Fibrobacteria bacterium]